MRLDLRAKIILITVVILTGSIAANTYVNSRTFSKEYSYALQEEASAIGQSLKLQLDRLVRLQIPIDELVGFEKQCKEVVEKHEVISYAMVVDIDGNILFHSDSSRQGSKSTPPPALNASTGEEDVIQINSEQGEDHYEITIPVRGPHGELVGAVKIGYPASIIAQKTRGLVVYSAVVALVSLVIAIVLLISSLSVWVTNPLQNLLSVIQDIRETGRATVERTSEIRTRDEIGQLHFAFNEMLGELEISHEKTTRAARELQSKNVQLQNDLAARKRAEEARSQLEIRVQERTKELEEANERLRQEIAERERLEARFLQAQKMESIGRLAGGVAHDFNNLLTAITGYATFVKDTLEPDMPAWKDIEQVLNAAGRAAALTQQLLACSRRQIIAPRTVNLNELVMTTNNLLRPLIGEDIELVTLPSPGLGLTRVDPGQLEQVLVNLVVNARDAMPDGGTLTIETANATLDESYVSTHMETVPGD